MDIFRELLPHNWENNETYKKCYDHSICVAEAARKIASKTECLDSDKAYNYGLLHDIGKFFTPESEKYKHPRIGYELIVNKFSGKLNDVAEICISHPFPDFSSKEYILRYCNGDKKETNRILNMLPKIRKNNYVDLIQLCDKISEIDKYITIDSKIQWYIDRYNIIVDQVQQNYISKIKDIKSKFDKLTKTDIYMLLKIDME